MRRPAAGFFAASSAQAAQPPIIAADRECAACGYNLRGLRVDSRCPECGAAIPPMTSSDDPLSRMPLRVIRIFRRAAWLATLSIVLAGAAVWSVMFGLASETQSLFAIAGVGVLWGFSMWLLTPVVRVPEAASRGFSAKSAIRRIARWGQSGWLLLVAGVIIDSLIGGGGPARAMKSSLQISADVAQVLGLLTGGVAMVAMAILMERLAEWARDDTAARLFLWFQWTLPLAIILLVVFRDFHVVRIFFHLCVLASALLFPLAMIMLTGSITLSAVHQMEYQDRERRRADRRQEDARILDERLRKMD